MHSDLAQFSTEDQRGHDWAHLAFVSIPTPRLDRLLRHRRAGSGIQLVPVDRGKPPVKGVVPAPRAGDGYAPARLLRLPLQTDALEGTQTE